MTTSQRPRRIALVLAFLLASLLSAGCDAPQKTETADKPPPPATRPEKADPADWCGGHDLPESMCTKCNPELVDGFIQSGDWCSEHGFPESACPICNPMEAPEGASEHGHGHDEHADEDGEAHADDHEGQGHEGQGHVGEAAPASAGEWCAGHGLPESMCTKCHPELTAKFKEKGDWCAEHGFPESGCPICNPMEPPEETEKAGPIPAGTVIRLKQADHEDAVGVETVEAKEATVGLGIRAPARIEFNRNAVADIRAPVPGIVRKVLVDLGDEVERGTRLFVLESARVGELQAGIRGAREELETARSNLERQKHLSERGISSDRKVELARQETEAAESKLASLESALRLAGAGNERSSGRFTVRSPIDGSVVRRPAVVGTAAGEEDSLATVADTKTMWAFVDVPESDSSLVSTGQPVVIHVGDSQKRDSEGEVTWISPEVNPKTRTVRVRAEVANPDGKLRANQFADAEIGIAPGSAGVVVPRDAVQRLDGVAVVFVRTKKGVFEPRVVEVGRSSGDNLQVRGPVEKGEPVVTTGAFLLKTELARDSIGAGCCEVPED